MVEWKKVQDIAIYRRGSFPQPYGNEEWYDGPNSMPFVQVADVEEGSMKLKDKTNQRISVKAMPKSVFVPQGTVIVTLQGSIGRVAITQYDSYVDRTLGIFEDYIIDVNKEYFAFQLANIFAIKRDKARGSTIKTITKEEFSSFIIPLPSIAKQQRIVEQLDTFTSSIENLKEQIAQRRKQYEYYRNKLLDLEGKEGVEMKYITDVAKSFTGLTYKPENVCDEGTLVLRSSNIDEDVLAFDDNVFVQMVIPERAAVKENDILICVRNGSKRLVGKAAMITKEAEGMAFGAFMTVLRSFDIDSKYLFYVWQSEKVKKQYKGDEAMPIAQITAKDFQRIVIPVPSLSEQQYIISILDTFEASIRNLEAQLSQREKQYEYYRNKLLTFD